jgi:hypothetical protein
LDDGPWPIAAALAEARTPGRWSLHFLNGSFPWQAALAGFEALAGLALALGWRTRVATVLAWVLTISAQSRNGLVLGGGSAVLRLLLFWGMWLPLGARWSLDARRRSPTDGSAPEAAFSMATAALLIQIALIYGFNALHKTGAAWHARGDAIAMTLQCEIYTRHAGRELLAWPGLLHVMTRFVYWMEAVVPLLIFLPWGTALIRTAAVFLFVTFHTGLAVTMNIGTFPYVCIVAWLALIPSEAWDRWRPRQAGLQRARLLPNALAATALIYVLCWNLRFWWPRLIPRPLVSIGTALRLDQRWRMFSPNPWNTEGWIVVVGTDGSGRETNLITGESPVNWRRPPDLGELAPDTAWRKFAISIAREGRGERRSRWYVEWLARKWQQSHPGAPPFVRLELYYLSQSIYDHQAVPDNYLIYEDPPSDLGKEAAPLSDSSPL